MQVFIYALADPINPKLPCYIGATSRSLEDRLYDHMLPSSGWRKVGRWIATLEGRTPIIFLLETTDDLNAAERETHWIQFFKPLGSLVNGTSRSGGKPGLRHSEEGRRRMSESRKGRSLTDAQWKVRMECIKKLSKKVICVETGVVFDSIGAAARHASVNCGNMSRHVRGELGIVKGYHYEFI